ncbi:MAG: ACT domain-containing protein [Candidatus Omnitrophica bacterium]|nr:ACT domain-containing protein [Candidatus Omnitrophota bacterium]
MKAVKGEEVVVVAPNKVGLLAAVTKLITEKSINIRAINGYVLGSDACFRLVTSDNAGTKEALSAIGRVENKEVIIIEMPDEAGQLAKVAAKLEKAGINLTHIYGTAAQVKGSAIIIFSSNDNNKALDVVMSAA